MAATPAHRQPIADIIWATNTTWYNGTTNVTANDTADSDGSKPGPLISLAVPLLMFCTGVLGNVVALVLLWRSRRDNARSVFYRLVAALALTDFFGIVATSPVTILVYSNDRKWVGGQPLCDYFSFMMIFAGLATVLVVGCMAVERFLAILHPYVYERHVSPERVKFALAGIWFIAALISCLPLVHVGRNVRYYPGTWCFFDTHSDRLVDRVFSFFYASIGLVVITATAVCNVAVMVVLLRMRRVSQNIGKSSEGRTLNMTSEMQMIFFLAGIIFVFATCYSPLMIRVMINSSQTVAASVEADLMAIRLASLNQILDPWVYLLFRRRLAALLYSACKTVSPLQTMSSLKALRSENGHGSFRNSPTLAGLRKAINGRHSPSTVARHVGDDKTGSGTFLQALKGDSPNGRCGSAVSNPEKKETSGSRASLVVKSDCNGHCSLELVPVGRERDFSEDSLLLEPDSPGGPCAVHGLSANGEERETYQKSLQSSQTDSYDGCRASEPEHHGGAVTEIVTEEAVRSSNPKPLLTDNEERTTCKNQAKNLFIVEDSERKPTSRVSAGVTVPNGILATEKTFTEKNGLVVGTDTSTLSSSASWPVICRHGNQTVVKVYNRNEDDPEGADCRPLLNKRHSNVETGCDQCKRTSKDLTYV